MGNTIINTVSKKFVKLSAGGAEGLYRGMALAGTWTGTLAGPTMWEKDILIWLAEKNQNLLGIGAAGFSVNNIGWSIEEFDAQKQFFLKTLRLTRRYKDWNNYNYAMVDAYMDRKAGELIDLFEALKVEEIVPGQVKFIFRKPDATEYRYCGKHNVLLIDAPLGSGQDCIVCATTILDSSLKLDIREISLPESLVQGIFLDITSERDFNSKEDVFYAADLMCAQKDLFLLGNLWTEIDFAEAREFILDGLTYSPAYTSWKISDDAFIHTAFEKIMAPLENQEFICALINTTKNPWDRASEGFSLGRLIPTWTCNFGCLIALKRKIIFALFLGED